MSNIDYCIFCGSEDVQVTRRNRKDRKTLFVECGHCAARSSSFSDTMTADGEFTVSDDELREEAIKSWNSAKRDSWWDRRVVKPWNQFWYDVGLFLDRFK